MKNQVKLILISFMMFLLFIPVSLAEGITYEVKEVSSSSSISLGVYNTYEEALTKMNSYSGSSLKSAVIYRAGEIVNSNYALVVFKDNNVIPLYKNAYDSSKYTSMNTTYAGEGALIDYHEATRRVKVKIAGFVGYVDINYVNVMPLSMSSSNTIRVNVNSIRVRDQAGLAGNVIGTVLINTTWIYTDIVNNVDGYNWYKINYNGSVGYVASTGTWTSEVKGFNTLTYYETYTTNNLIHYYGNYINSNPLKQSFINNGPTPGYLPVGVKFYSYDGNYFYQSLETMLDDYKANTFKNSVNSNDPFYFYYQYLPNRSFSNFQAADYNNLLIKKGYYRGKEPGVVYVDANGNYTNADRSGVSVLYNSGEDFISVQNEYAINAFQAFSTSLSESASGTSKIALAKNNVFGLSAYDSCPFTCATTFTTLKDSIIGYARLTGGSYSNPNHSFYHGAFYGNLNSGMNVYYATDPYWGEKNSSNYLKEDREAGYQDLYSNTVGIKQSDKAVLIKREPSSTSKTVYTLKNINHLVSNMALIVTDKVYNEGVYWYRILTDTALDQEGNVTNTVYTVKNSYGYILETDLYVKNKQPVITATDKTITIDEPYNLMDAVTAYDEEDKDISYKVEIESTTLNKDIAGIYQVTYKVTDSGRFNSYKTVNVRVVGNSNPTITVVNNTVSQYKAYDLKTMVSALDNEGTDISDKVIITGTIDNQIIGDYKLTVSVTDKYNQTTTEEITISVVKNQYPVINVTNKDIVINSTFDPKLGVSANDFEDGILDVTVVSNSVDSLTLGVYDITYSTTDLDNQTTTKTIKVTVTNRTLKEGLFYFHSLTREGDNLVLRGYQTIKGMNNDLSTNINYNLLFVNKDDNSYYNIPGVRITDDKEIYKEVYSADSFNYKYSWFKVIIDESLIKDGDYNAYIQAIGDTVYSESLVNNRFYNKEDTSYNGVKNFFIKNEYGVNKGALLFNIKTNLLSSKTAFFNYNQYGSFTNFETIDNKLYLRGINYSYGMDLSKAVKRNIIFENTVDQTVYKYELGSTTGDYEPALPVNDNLRKSYAWYDAKLDLSNIKVGNYVLYIETISNITDIDYFTERLGRTLSNVINVDGKTYTFSINNNRYKRIEMQVK